MLDRAAGRLTLMAFAIAGVMLVGGCQAKDTRVTISSTPDMAALRPDAAFTCSKEADHIPARDPEADQLYQHARWLRRNNLLKDDPAVYPVIERLVRISTAHGHDKANLALRGMLKNGQAQSPNPIKESVDLVEDLIQRGIPGGYHDMGNYLMQGYGVVGDFDLGKRYYRKAADLGSPDAQYLIGDKLIDTRRHPPEVVEIGLQMLRCAAEQGHAEAALGLGVYIYEEKPEEAMHKTRTRGADECHTDALDRVKVKFHWQANPFALQPANTNHSCWVRMVQRAATAGGAAAASDTAALAESSDHRPSSQMNLVNSGSGGHSPAWHGMVRLQMGGSEYLWRFADPQMLQATSMIMTPEQRIAVFGGCRSWWIVTADGTPKDMAFSTAKLNAETTQPLRLDASQEHALLAQIAPFMLASQLRSMDAHFKNQLTHAEQITFSAKCIEDARGEFLDEDTELLSWALSKWQEVPHAQD